MPTFLFLAAVCLLVADASPPQKTNTKLENDSSSSGNSEPNADASPEDITPDASPEDITPDASPEDITPDASPEDITPDASPEDITPEPTIQTQWDSEACNAGLTLSESNVVEHTGNNCGVRSVRAKEPIPNEKSGIFYFEVEILAFTGSITMGLATNKLKLDQNVENQGYAYDSSGYITGIDFNEKHAFIVRNKIVGETVVGCGVDLEKRQIFYTKNGELLGTVELSDDVKVHKLFPAVSMQSNGSKIEANFGLKEFKFDFAKVRK